MFLQPVQVICKKIKKFENRVSVLLSIGKPENHKPNCRKSWVKLSAMRGLVDMGRLILRVRVSKRYIQTGTILVSSTNSGCAKAIAILLMILYISLILRLIYTFYF